MTDAGNVIDAYREDRAMQLSAAAAAALIVLLLGRLLMMVPTLPSAEPRSEMRVRLLTRAAPAPAQRPPPATPIEPSIPSSTLPAATAAVPSPPRRAPVTKAPPPTATPKSGTAARLYDRNGRLQLPPSAQIDPMAPPPPGMAGVDTKPGPFERENSIEVETTRFDKDWKTDGSLGAVAAQKMDRGMKAVAKAIFGEDPQEVRARPPPDVGFNPAAYEQPSDLGSEATGDAYKAAPIVHEKAPGLKGEASRRIAAQLQTLRQRASPCTDTYRQQLLAPVRRHLQDLQQAEHAFKQGADPVMAEQMLPRRADNAYDQARRALWYADQQWTHC